MGTVVRMVTERLTIAQGSRVNYIRGSNDIESVTEVLTMLEQLRYEMLLQYYEQLENVTTGQITNDTFHERMVKITGEYKKLLNIASDVTSLEHKIVLMNNAVASLRWS